METSQPYMEKTQKAKPPSMESMEVWNWKIIELNGTFSSKPCLIIYKKLSALADLIFAEKIAGTFPIPFFQYRSVNHESMNGMPNLPSTVYFFPIGISIGPAKRTVLFEPTWSGIGRGEV